MFQICLMNTQKGALPRIVLRVDCYLNGMLSNSTINSYERYTTSPSRNPRLFNQKPFLLPCKGEMS